MCYPDPIKASVKAKLVLGKALAAFLTIAAKASLKADSEAITYFSASLISFYTFKTSLLF